MQLTLTQLDFSVSLNACHDEIMHKMEVLTNMQIELLRKFQHQLGNSEMHLEMIHDVRVMIVTLEEVYKDVKEYFNEMGIQFVYDFFRKIQVLMVCGYNFMSQALLVNVDKFEDKKIKDATTKGNILQCKVCKCTCSQGSKSKKKETKQVEHYDYKISLLENEEQKIASEIQGIYQKMMMQKSMIEKTKPSLAIRQLQDMKEHIENVMQSTNSIFQETYMMKYVEFKNYLTQIKKPQDMIGYFVTNMNFNIKEKFLQAMQKAIYKAQHMEKRIQRKKHSKDIEMQTDKIKENNQERDSIYRGFSSLKPEKNQTLLTKQRKFNQKMMAEVQYVRKQLNSFTAQNQKLKNQLESKENNRKKIEEDYLTLEQLYSKRSLELENVQNQNKWLASERQNQVKKLKSQIKELKKEQIETISLSTQTFIPPNYVNSSTQTQIIYFQNQVQNQIINVLKKTNEKMVLSLNQKQKKIRELLIGKEDMRKLKDCKLICTGFLDDLRQVTSYKIRQSTKQSKLTDKISSSKEPIVPLNQNTSNNSIIITINKLSEQIKALLFPSQNNKNFINQRRSSFRRESVDGTRVKLEKVQKVVDNSPEQFFKNMRKSSVISLQAQLTVSQFKRSSYQKQSVDKNQRKQSASQSSISEIKSSLNSTSKSPSSIELGQSKIEIFNQQTKQLNQKRKPSFNTVKKNLIFQKFDSKKKQKSIRKTKKLHRIEMQIQTDIFGLINQKNILSQNKNKDFIFYGEYSQQTNLTMNQLRKFQQKQEKQGIRFKNKTQMNKQNGSFSNRKQSYIRKPRGRITIDNFKTEQSDRNYEPVNHSLAIKEGSMSQRIQQSQEKFRQQTNFSKATKQNIDYREDSSAQSQRMPCTSTFSLSSRLSNLINTKNSMNCKPNSILFKNSNPFEKSSPKLLFDQLKIQKNIKQKQKEVRNTQFNIWNDFNIIQQQTKPSNHAQNLIPENNSSQKQNQVGKHKFSTQTKSIFIEKIIEQDDIYSRNSIENQPLIEVCRKTPVQRERKSFPRNLQLPQTVFTRVVKQLLLSTQSKQDIIDKVEKVCLSLEEQKNQKRLKKIIRGSYMPRGSEQRSNDRKKQFNQVFKLGELVY